MQRSLFRTATFVAVLCLTAFFSVEGGWRDWIPGKDKKPTTIEATPASTPPPDPSGNALRVLAVAPQGSVEDKGETISVTVTFDRPMVALQALPSEEKPGPIEFDPPIKGKYRWFGTSTLVFTPSEPLPIALRTTAKVPAGTKAYDGSTLSEDYVWTFDTVRPELMSSDPYHGSQWVDLKVPVFMAFSVPMSPQRARDFFVLRGKPTKNIFGPIDPYHAEEYTEEFPVTVRKAIEEEYKKRPWTAKTKDQCLIVTPSRPLKKEYTYSLILKEGLLAAAGNLGLMKERVLQFKTYNNFRVYEVQNEIHPAEGLQIQFTNPVVPKKLKEALSVDPTIKWGEYVMESDYPDESFSLPGSLKPRQVYHLKIDGKLQDKFDQKLGDTWSGDVNVTSYVPWISGPSGLITVEDKMAHRLPVSFINMASAFKSLKVVTPREAIPSLLTSWQYGGNDTLDIFGNKEPWVWKVPLNQSVTAPLDLNKALGASKKGFMFVRIEGNEPDSQVESYPRGLYYAHHRNPTFTSFVQVTNLGITSKCSPESNLVWVTFLSSAKPIPGAKVELYDDDAKLLWQGETNKSGLVTTPGWAYLNIATTTTKRYQYDKPNPRVWIVASYRDDKAMVASNWGTGIYPWAFGLPYEYRQLYPDYAGHVYTDRGLYQAGEPTEIKGLFRSKKNSDWVISPIKTVHLTITNPRGETVLEQDLKVSEFGSFHTTFLSNAQMPTGTYAIRVREKDAEPESNSTESEGYEGDYDSYGSNQKKLSLYGSFQIEAYRPATFEVTVSLEQPRYFIGEKANFKAKGWYLFGAPMKKAPVLWHARLTETSYAPPGHDAYWFGPRRYLSDYASRVSTVELGSGKEQLDDEGELKKSIVPEAKSLLGPQTLTIEATVTDQDRQSISGRKSALVHPSNIYLGLKASTTFIEKKKPIEISMITVDPDGKLVPNRSVIISVVREEWHSVRKSGVNGRTLWETQKSNVNVWISTETLKKGEATVSYTPDQAGYYLVHAEAKDDLGRMTYADYYFYVTGTDYIPWERTDDDKIELVADKTNYKPGDAAKIMVKSPYENAIGLISVEREGILKQFVVNLKGSADVVTLPLDEKFVPNVFVSVVLLQGRTAQGKFGDDGEDVGKPGFKIGYVNLAVDPGTRRLTVNVKSDQKEYRPRGKVTVQFQVKNSEGVGKRAECSISVADRGILDLIGYQTPNSFNSFYGPRSLSVETVESRLHVIGQRNYGEKGENAGGGGLFGAGLLSDSDLRSLFKGTAFWKADMVTDANGNAEVTFDLPDDLTTFKIMVTAQTKESLFGAGDSEFIVKKPLMLNSALPRFARLGDRFDAGVVVHNLTGKDGELSIEAQSQGLTQSGGTVKKVAVKSGEAKEVRFSYKADAMGTSKLKFGALLGSEKDGLDLSLPVILPRVTEAVALYDSTTDKAEQPLIVPNDIYQDVGGLQIEAASTAMLGLKEGIRYLEEYPNECLEQKTSRLIPFVLAEDVLDAFGLATLKGKNRKQVIEEALKQFPKFQAADGGFKFWPDSWYPSEYLTAYVMFFLKHAKDDGFAVDEKMTTSAIGYMSSVLRRPDDALWNYPYRRNEQLVTNAFITYSLALWGQQEPGYVSKLYSGYRDLPLFGRAMLLKAIRLNQMNKSMEDEVAMSLFNYIKEDPTRVHFEEQNSSNLEWIFDSSVRTTAYILQSMLESGRDFPQAPKVVRWIMDERKQGRWRTTQENLYVFYALSQYFQTYEKEDPKFSAKIQVAGRDALTALFEGRSNEAKQTTLKWDQLTPGQETKAVAEKSGSGRLYYGLRMIYAPKAYMPAREEGLKIEREVTTQEGKAVPSVIKAGTKLLVKLTVTTPFDRSFIAAEGPLPAGFQVVQTGFQTANSNDATTESQAQKSERWWNGFNHKEVYDDRVVFYADFLGRGTYTLVYTVTANTPGEFSMPAAKAEGMYTPEVFGRTADQKVEIQ